MIARALGPAGLAITLLALAACQAGDAMPTGRGIDPVVIGPALAPAGAWGLCIRNPEDLRCQPTAD